MIDLEKFLSGYIECAIWSTTDYRADDQDGNHPYNLDDEFDSVSDACRDAMRSDCEAFIKENEGNLEHLKNLVACEDWRLGFLFWLNRSGHGSGFWDEVSSMSGDDVGELLSEASKPYGTFEIYGDFEMGCVRSHHYG